MRTYIEYLVSVLPLVRNENRRWSDRATAIPDPVLRRQAQESLRAKASNVAAVAIFATLAPIRLRRTAAAAMVTFQIAVDYLDTVTETASHSPLADRLHLHKALERAIAPADKPIDWYRHHPRSKDGNYLQALLEACQESLRSLPSFEAVRPVLRSCAARCGEAQSYTHWSAEQGEAPLRDWARQLWAEPAQSWWEIAAGASSSVAVHALIGAAARDCSTENAAAIEAAYFPSVGALTVLLDDLVDEEEDAGTGDHSFLAYYSGPEALADGLARIASTASSRLDELPQAKTHSSILAGIVAFYMAAAARRSPGAEIAAERLLEVTPGARSALRLLSLGPSLI